MLRVAGYYVINSVVHVNKLNIYIHISFHTDSGTGQCFFIFTSPDLDGGTHNKTRPEYSKIRLKTYMWAADEELRIGALWKEM